MTWLCLVRDRSDISTPSGPGDLVRFEPVQNKFRLLDQFFRTEFSRSVDFYTADLSRTGNVILDLHFRVFMIGLIG